jgi:hypothetical protein
MGRKLEKCLNLIARSIDSCEGTSNEIEVDLVEEADYVVGQVLQH